MNILIVDDQKAIVDSLRDGIDWKSMGLELVFAVCSAREARLVISSFDIDILLTDIEMPEEDGLELFKWTRAHYPDIIGIFLTSHADFEYARQAIVLGGFDYILQPARYEDVMETVQKAIEKQKYTRKIHNLEKRSRFMFDQMNAGMDYMMRSIIEHRSWEGNEVFSQIKEFFGMDYHQCVFWPVWISICYFEKVSPRWDEKLLRMVFANVLEEVFLSQRGKACIGSHGLQDFLAYVIMDKKDANYDTWHDGIEEFTHFVNTHMDFAVAVYPANDSMDSFRAADIEIIEKRCKANTAKKTGLFWEDMGADSEAEHNEERIRLAVQYIRDNVSQSISRAQVAQMLHLNEEYFSRLFKKYTGYTFKDYEVMERMNQAKRLLEHSRFSISIIASKVGYDNFSHFSRVFKKMTGQTPQEYRKVREKQK